MLIINYKNSYARPFAPTNVFDRVFFIAGTEHKHVDVSEIHTHFSVFYAFTYRAQKFAPDLDKS